MKKEQVIAAVEKHHRLFSVLTKIFNRLNLKNRFHHTSKCKLSVGVSFLNGVRINNSGENNTIRIGDFCRIKGSTITIHGNNNNIDIGNFVYMNNVELYMEDDENTIKIDYHTSMCGNAHLATLEGTAIVIGKDCLFSSDIHFRTGDSHSVLDMNGNRINPSEDIIVGDHVWIGTKVVCLKGTQIADDCIVGAATTLCKKYDTPHCIIAGAPGKIVKKDISWTSQRIPVKS